MTGANHPTESIEARLNKTFLKGDKNDDGKLTKEGIFFPRPEFLSNHVSFSLRGRLKAKWKNAS